MSYRIKPVCSTFSVMVGLTIEAMHLLVAMHPETRAHLQALEVFTVAQRMAAGGFAIAALSGAAAVGGGRTAPSMWAAIAAACLLSAVTVWQLEAQRCKLLFVDYVHSER